MGLTNDNTRGTFVNIKKGFFYATIDGKEIKENTMTGYLRGIEIKQDEFDGVKYDKLSLTMEDEERTYLVQMKFASGYANGVLMTLRNLDLTQPVSYQADYKETGGKKESKMWVKQGGTNVKWVWTRDNPGDLPQWKKVVFNGEEKFDKTDQIIFLKELVKQTNEKLKEIPKAAPKVEVQKGKVLITEPIGDDTWDDLPF
jgi:hypothetical protein